MHEQLPYSPGLVSGEKGGGANFPGAIRALVLQTTHLAPLLSKLLSFLMAVPKAMHKIWISAALAPALALQAGPLWAEQRTPTTVVACSGTFAKDSSHLELTTAFNSKDVTFADVEAADGTKVPASIL